MILRLADWLVYGLMGLDSSAAVGRAVHFFVSDRVMLPVLLSFISVLMGLVNAYFPIKRLRN